MSRALLDNRIVDGSNGGLAGSPTKGFLYLRARYLNKPWGIKVDENYKPKVTIIVPTYREAEFIWDKLNDIYHLCRKLERFY